MSNKAKYGGVFVVLVLVAIGLGLGLGLQKSDRVASSSRILTDSA